jgi:hypothetical protein
MVWMVPLLERPAPEILTIRAEEQASQISVSEEGMAD